jgi:general secretion pathway protein G
MSHAPSTVSTRARRAAARGFTLVEILIVVIILGILAAIVIPQFTSASEDARKNALTGQLQTIRSQLELYKLQHRDEFPTGLQTAGTIAATTAFNELVVKTNDAGTTDAADGEVKFGPYLQSAPINGLNSNTAVLVVATDIADPSAYTVTDTTAGWVFSQASGKFWAVDKAKTGLYAE